MEPTQLPLRDIHPPPEISWWPPALGWWLLAALIPAIILFSLWLYKRLTRKTALKTGRKLLQEIKQDSRRDNNKKIKDISALIRRVAVTLDGRKACAGLTGNSWLEYLDRTLDAKNLRSAPFVEGIGRLLSDLPYRKEQPGDAELNQLTDLCESWLNAQRKRKR